MQDKNPNVTIANEALTPAELIKKHNSNPKHFITEDEMRNLKVGDDVETAAELKKDIEEKEAEEYHSNHENNCYDILDA